jgi:hypothetical protein
MGDTDTARCREIAHFVADLKATATLLRHK